MSINYNSNTLKKRSATIGVSPNYTEINECGRLAFYGEAKSKNSILPQLDYGPIISYSKPTLTTTGVHPKY